MSTSDSLDEDDLPSRILILYASETGNAQDIAERTGREVRRRGGRCTVQSMVEFDIQELPHTPLLILINSTHGRGQPPPDMVSLWSALLRSGLPSDILEDVNFAIYGLGDSSYEKFCFAGKILARRMISLGARLVAVPLSSNAPSGDSLETEFARKIDIGKGEVDEDDEFEKRGCLAWGDERAPDGLEETFLPWLEKTMSAMIPLLHPPVSKEIQAPPIVALPQPLYRLENVDSAATIHVASSHGTPASDGKKVKASIEDDDDVLQPGWLWTTLKTNKRVTAEGWFQDVREIDLNLEPPVAYDPGSICSLKPQSSEEEIQTFLSLNGLEDAADQPFVIRPLNPDQPIPLHLPRSKPTTLRRILRDHVDVRQSPRKSFFEWMARFTESDLERERLEEFLADPDEIHTYATKSRRTLLETLADFRSTKIPLSYILEVLPPLRRRQFSIASSSKVHPGEIQLLVGLVEYKTNLKIRRKGLLSSWLKDLPEGYRIPIKIDAPTLFLPKESKSVPVILVGPGTGVAPMRAFVEERIRTGAARDTAIYFGCRSKQQDFYYADEWDEMRKTGVTVRIAFSRDQDEKLYVQDLIKQDAKRMKEWIFDRGGNVYISGSSNAMPKAVRAAIAWSISTESGEGILDREAADRYVEDMFMSGKRGGEESW
ncbi:hypothetical protein NliqN6_2827 [Naganishia liquefaciens]|uniref:NADPH-dependent FMN and FAD-containing oxidoreductase n=1 Tax=Naganishia liquefaciens TaxID=104408 RepID=A0A8H3YEC8_9TREE|nr:hypothetical protein NliqN6_2827 [Naganishia liquefaciens]